METVSKILEHAKERAIKNGVTYAGSLTPHEAFDILQAEPAAVLVDVRTRAELELVGFIPQSTHIEWATYPGMVANADFSNQLLAALDKDLTLIFICRTGGRSHHAALTAAKLGYSKAYNMLEGFEGEANQLKQRTQINGWKHAGLPWSN